MKRGFFAIGIENFKKDVNVGSLWRAAHALGASYIFTVGRKYTRQASDTSFSQKHIPYFAYSTINEFLSSLPDNAPIVGVEIIPNAHDIISYSHPERAVYVLGAEDCGLSSRMIASCHQLIKIPSLFSLNVASAGTIVIYDRLAKKQNNEK